MHGDHSQKGGATRAHVAPMRSKSDDTASVDTASPGSPCTSLQQRVGNRALQALLARPQAPVIASGDVIEREADHQALHVTRDRRRPVNAQPVTPLDAIASPYRAPDAVLPVLDEPGNGLDAETQAALGPRLGLKLDQVRVHTGQVAARSAAALGARAYAYGEHMVFSAGAYTPHNTVGRRLIAHELAHIRQQALTGTPFVARQDHADLTPSMPGEVVTELRPGLVRRQGPGYLRLEVAGREWLRLEWDPSQSATPDVQVVVPPEDDPGYENGMGVGLRVRAGFEMHATLNRDIESISSGPFYRLYSYDFQFSGVLRIGDQDVPLPYRHRELYPPTRSREFERPLLLSPPTAESLDPLRDSPLPGSAPDQRQTEQEEERHQDMIRGHPAFDTRAEMETYIREHPDEAFVGITTSFGRFVARRVNEAELQRLADVVREDPDNLPEVAWGVETRTSGWGVTGIYQGGRAVDLDAFRDLWYGDDLFAMVGGGDSFEEAEVFRMGTRSFGRKPLDHDQAVARWDALGAMETAAVRRLNTEPGRRFHALWVRGAGRIHEIDESYFTGRDAFYREIASLDQDMPATYNAMIESPNGNEIRTFLMAELDREQRSARLVGALTRREELADAVSMRVYFQVETRAQQLALERIESGRGQLAVYATNADRMRTLVMGFPDMSGTERNEAMAFIGVPITDRSHVGSMLSSREGAMRVALGLEETQVEEDWETVVVDNAPAAGAIRTTTTYRVSIERLMGWASTTVAGMEQAAQELRSGSVKALRLEGELGNQVRRLVYDEMGFNLLRPEGFPHGDETSGWFPDPLDPGPMVFTSLAEQMYANHVRNQASMGTVFHVLGVTGMVIASIVLILVAQEAGLVVAGLLFAEGSAAFVATEIIVSGLVFTGLSELQTRLVEGRWSSPTDIGIHGAVNIATFGAFRYLNTLLAAGARSFVAARVGGEDAFMASRGAQRAAGALRIGGVGATFFIVGIGQRLLSGQGFSSWGDFALFAYENLLTLALLEGGAYLARPLMTESSIWARANRLGAFEGEIVALRGDAARLQRDLASLAVRPQASEREAPGLIERTRTALETQRDLCSRLRENFRNRGDATALEQQAGVELEGIQIALDGIRQAEFLVQQRVTPIESSESVFTYEGGSAAAERFRVYYGEERVQVGEDGRIRVQVPGLEAGELVFVPAESVAPAAGTTAPTLPDIVQRQQLLTARQTALLTRARRLGVSDPTLDQIRGNRLRVGQRTRPEALDEAEQLITRAESVAGARMDQLARNILDNVRSRLGARAIEQIRAGELASVTDAELADVLWQARGLQDMGVAQLRALVFASRPGEPAIDFIRLLRIWRNGRFGVAARNFALETFTQMMERRLPGARATLADMAASTGRFRGGLFEMEAIRYLGGLENVSGTQVRRAIGARAREYDIELSNGQRVECKDWSTWEYADGSLGDPFERDVASLTDNFTNPSGIRRMRYLFRNPPPRSVANIRAFLRGRLENALRRAEAEPATREAMLAEFDDYLLLVEAPDLQRSGGAALPGPTISPPSPALPTDDDEDQDGGVGGGDGGAEDQDEP